jgi:cell division protein FtsN
MAGREDGEFELILGNKQLLSVLFIVIVLLGVFFAMGFLAGRSTGEAGAALTKAESRGPIVVDSTAGTRSDARPGSATELPPVRTSEPEPPKAEEKPGAVLPPPSATPTAPDAPVPGSYLQVAATTRQQADNMLSILAQKGFKVATAPSPKNPELYRVLVGPLPSPEETAKIREALRGIGIDKPYLVKY